MSAEDGRLRSATVGVVGLGRIGLPVARNLTAAGYAVAVCDVNPGAVAAAEAFGCRPASSVQALAAQAGAVVIAVPGPEADRSVLLGATGLAETAKAGDLIIDLTTVAVDDSRAFADVCAAKGIDYLEAPVSGSEQGAVDGALTIMAAGALSTFARAKPVLEVLGSKIVHVGAPGQATLLKLINQSIYISYMLAFAEGVAAGEAAGIDLDTVLGVLASSAAGAPEIERKFPEIRGASARCFSAANAKRYLDFALASIRASPIIQAAAGVLDGAVAAGLGSTDVTALRRVRRAEKTAT